MKHRFRQTTAMLLSALFAFACLSAQAAERWDMPMAYADGNFHTQNGKAFAEAVKIATGVWVGLSLIGVAWVGLSLFSSRPPGDAMITTSHVRCPAGRGGAGVDQG